MGGSLSHEAVTLNGDLKDEQGLTEGRRWMRQSEGQRGWGSGQRKLFIESPSGQVDLGASGDPKASRTGGQGSARAEWLQRRPEVGAEVVFILERQGNVEKYKKGEVICLTPPCTF